MTSSVTDVVLNQTVPSINFLTVESLYEVAAKILGMLVPFWGAWPQRLHSDCAASEVHFVSCTFSGKSSHSQQ